MEPRAGGTDEARGGPIPEAPVVVPVDLGLRIIFGMVSFGLVGVLIYGAVRRLTEGPPIGAFGLLIATGIVAAIILFLVHMGCTRLVVDRDRVRVTGLIWTREFDRAAIVRMDTLTGPAPFLRPPYLVLAERTEVMTTSRWRSEAKASVRSVVTVPGLSKPRVMAVLAGDPDPDDITLCESARRVRQMFISDDGRPQLLVFAFLAAVAACVLLAIAGAAGATGPIADQSGR